MFAHQPIYPNRSHPINDFFGFGVEFVQVGNKTQRVVTHKKDLRIFWGQKMARNHHISRNCFFETARPGQK
jgi:hypothetical protein